MSKCRRGNFFLVSVSVLVLLFGTACFAQQAKPSAKDLVNKKCTSCHTVKLFQKEQNKTVAEWIATINRMKSAGLVIDKADQETIAAYLSKTIVAK